MWSVNNGCKFAQFEQGAILFNKATTQAERDEAYALIKKAADQNEVRAMLYYAVALAKGESIYEYDHKNFGCYDCIISGNYDSYSCS